MTMIHNINICANIIDGRDIRLPNGCTATPNIRCYDIHDIIETVNNIYVQAGIQFTIASCKQVNGKSSRVIPDQSLLGNDVTNIENLFDWERLWDPDCLNIFVVPVIGDDTNAYHTAFTDDSYIVIGVNNPIDCEQMSIQEIANILSHEIGHDLGLTHYDEAGNLMTPYTPHGTRLTDQQIDILMQSARDKYPEGPQRSTSLLSIRDIYQSTRKIHINKCPRCYIDEDGHITRRY